MNIWLYYSSQRQIFKMLTGPWQCSLASDFWTEGLASHCSKEGTWNLKNKSSAALGLAANPSDPSHACAGSQNTYCLFLTPPPPQPIPHSLPLILFLNLHISDHFLHWQYHHLMEAAIMGRSPPKVSLPVFRFYSTAAIIRLSVCLSVCL